MGKVDYGKKILNLILPEEVINKNYGPYMKLLFQLKQFIDLKYSKNFLEEKKTGEAGEFKNKNKEEEEEIYFEKVPKEIEKLQNILNSKKIEEINFTEEFKKNEEFSIFEEEEKIPNKFNSENLEEINKKLEERK